ncbi:MAG: HEAT repeat domain-containing protein [Candidatus Riflebacteria bacterium]|nr:HEAT repeat domain-containing protein [Candidatus Riflebacteria bacterium]
MSQELALSLFSDLRSHDPSVRFSVVSRIENIAWNEELINAFSILTQTECDPAIKLYMQLILERVSRDKGKQVDKNLILKEFDALAKQPESDSLRFVLMLESLEPDQLPLSLVALKENNWSEYSVLILPFVLKFIRKHRISEFIDQVENLCHHSDPQVLSAAIEVLERLAPHKIEPLLVPLLTNSNYGIRSKAVRILYRLDQQEALKHFEAMLFSSDKDEKDAAMFHAYFFPFDKIESLLLRFMAVETSPELLKKAGYLFQVNPDFNPPLHLIEIMEGTLGSKKEIFSEILRGVLNAQSRLLKKPVDELLEQLKRAYRNKKANELIAQCRLSWDASNATRKQAIVNKLEELAYKGFSSAKEALVVLGITDVELSCIEAPRMELLDLSSLDSKQRILIWKSVNEKFLDYSAQIIEIWNKMSSEEKILVLGKSLQFKAAALVKKIGARALKDTDDVVAAAAIECMMHLDTDTLFPQLPGLLNHTSTDVQSAAIKVYALYDKDQAVRLLEKMLTQSVTARSSALFHLAQFDFPSVQNVLFNCLQLEDDDSNLRKIEAIFASNIDLEMLYRVFRISRSEKDQRKSTVENIFSRLAEAYQQKSDDSSQTIISLVQNFSERLESERTKEAKAPAYSLENIQKLRIKKNAATPAIQKDDDLLRFTLAAFVGTGFIAWVIWLVVLSPFLPPPPKSTKTSLKAGESYLSGNIEKVMSHGISIKADGSNREVLLTLPDVQHGKLLKVRVKQHKQQDGTTRAELIELIKP